jgi:hypothetical protein
MFVGMVICPLLVIVAVTIIKMFLHCIENMTQHQLKSFFSLRIGINHNEALDRRFIEDTYRAAKPQFFCKIKKRWSKYHSFYIQIDISRFPFITDFTDHGGHQSQQ